MDRRILAAMRQMEREMGDDLRVDAIAGALGLSVHHFHRLFAQETGESPASFLRRIRMDAAALRLKWADEPTGTIAYALGFRSRPAFIRAFERQFGMPPARYRKQCRADREAGTTLNGRRVSLRDEGGFHLLTKRYVGDIFRLADYWRDFLASIPADLAEPGRALYIGQLYDDFRITDPSKVRYDCGVTVNASHEDSDGSLAAAGLHLLRTEAGRFGRMEHRGPYQDVPVSYDLLCHGWLIPNGYVPGSNPAIEIHTTPRHLQNPEDLSFTILFPVE